MPVTTTPSAGFTVGSDTSLTISHTSDAHALYVLLSWFVASGGSDSTDVVTGVTFNGTALERGGRAVLAGQTMEWWLLPLPDTGTHDVVISLNDAKRVTAGVLNLSGWPVRAADHEFASAASSTSPVSVSVDSRTGAEVITWLGFNATTQDITVDSEATELWNQDTENVTTGDPEDGDQRSAASLYDGAESSVEVSWTAGLDEFFGVAALSFTVSLGRHLIAGDTHIVRGLDNAAVGRTHLIAANNAEAHGESVTVAGDRSIGINLTDTAQTVEDEHTLEAWADAIRLHGPTTLDGQYGSPEYDAGNSGTALEIDWENGNTQLVTLTGDCTFTFSNPASGGRYLIALKQDGSGSHTVTWPSSVKWAAGTAPTLTTTAGHVDIVTFVYFAGLGASGNYLAAANTDYTPA